MADGSAARSRLVYLANQPVHADGEMFLAIRDFVAEHDRYREALEKIAASPAKTYEREVAREALASGPTSDKED